MPDAIWPDAGELSPHARTPLYQQLEDLIRSRIADGRLGPGDMLPPELDLAERFGVSRTTIRQALGALVQEGMLSRTAGRGTFVERSRPQGLHAVALVCPFTQWYMGDLIHGLERVLKSAGYELIVRNSQHSAEAEVCELEQLQSLDVAGVVLWPEST
ncbi:MAG TPA: GntR family transcriptional regulator, partial [Limnochordia bacterium]|nr:GntR family transcriptional regulator [Limnochordia bacterium]